MQPNNTPERKKAFINFLLLFCVSAAIVILLAFSSVQVPLKQNSQLRAQTESADKEREFSQKFMGQMNEIINMLDSINTKATKPEILDGQITESISKLNLAVNADSMYNKDLYRNVVLNLADLQTARKTLRGLTASSTDINQLQKRNDDLTAQLEQCKKDKDAYSLQINQLLSQH
ncbi:MAG: hypothetical protein JWP81_3415 [Ferruginibacter sp.]|nr:hypothetical protein [Ferruginibacter sp.]